MGSRAAPPPGPGGTGGVAAGACGRSGGRFGLTKDRHGGAEGLRRKPPAPPHAEGALGPVSGHDPAEDPKAVLATPNDPSAEESLRGLPAGEVDDRLAAVLPVLALTERDHGPGQLGLRHADGATAPSPIRARTNPGGPRPRADAGSMEEPGGLQLGRDLLDRELDVGGLPGPRAHELPAPEEEDDDLRLREPVHEPGELLRLVLDVPQAEGDRNRVEVDLRPEVRRGDDVLDPDLGQRNRSGGQRRKSRRIRPGGT